MRDWESKQVPFAQLEALGNQLRKTARRVVSTNGCFDLLHVGHLRYLRQARALGDALVIGLNSDVSVQEIKGTQRPIQSAAIRLEQLASLEVVDYLCIFEESRPDKFIEALKPDIHVKGGDYTLEQLPEREMVARVGGEIQILPMVDGFSTTELIGKIKNAY